MACRPRAEGGAIRSHVRLRPFEPTDREVVRRWINDPAAAGPFPQSSAGRSERDIRRLVEGKPEPNIVRLAVEADGQLIGQIQYRYGQPMFPPDVFHIGIAIWDPAQRGRGFGLEAQRQLVDMLFREHRPRRVEAGTAPGNTPERRCLESLGFVQEGTLRKFFPGPGDVGDIVIYGLLRDEWQARRRRSRTARTT